LLLTIGTVSNYAALLTPGELDDRETMQAILNFNQEHPLSHYFVCESNRLRIDSQDIEHKEDCILFTVPAFHIRIFAPL
jgi:hypothetical protein